MYRLESQCMTVAVENLPYIDLRLGGITMGILLLGRIVLGRLPLFYSKVGPFSA